MQNKSLESLPADSPRDGHPRGTRAPSDTRTRAPSDTRTRAPSAAERAVERALDGRRLAYAGEVRRLLEATFVLIERTGELEPRVGDIVREAGLSNQAFYRHFASKQALLVAVLDEGVGILASYLRHRMQPAPRPSDQVCEWLRGLLEQALSPAAARATRPFVLARTRLAEAHPREVAESERQLTELVREALRAALETGELPAVDPEGDAETLYQLAMGWLQARLRDERPPDRRDAERLVDFALHGLSRGTTTSADAEA